MNRLIKFPDMDHYAYELDRYIIDTASPAFFREFVTTEMLTFDICALLIACDPVTYTAESIAKQFMQDGRTGEFAIRFHAGQVVYNCPSINTVRQFFHILVDGQTEVTDEDTGDTE